MRCHISHFLCLAWLLLLVAGLTWFCQYQNAPGAQAQAPQNWPPGVVLPRDPQHMTLVMIVHPLCPCSRASLAELDQLLARCRGKLTADVVFVQYVSLRGRLADSDNWRQAAAIPGVHLVADADGGVARRFGAQTSGQCYLYDSEGHRLFQGGLTGGRGEEGDSAGLAAVAALVSGHHAACAHTLVFGCPLFPELENKTSCPSRT